ncbi:MAG TPA: hypothetical protein VH087_15565, partial [Thermoanaerobaculia bacterium]|nr:hypothetical protein [Thermoanaerobaculia bacterium]
MHLKRAVAAVLFVLSAPALFGGVAYRFDTVTSGLGEQRISGSVEAEAQRMRVNIAAGDGVTYPDGSFVLVDGNHVMVFDPGTKTYYELVADPLGSLKTMLGDAALSNEHSSVRDLGNGHNIMTSSYDLNVAVLEKKMKMHAVITTESWTTNKYPEWASIAKIFSSSEKAPKGFPTKQVTTFRIDQNGTPIEMTSTTTVSDVVTKPIPATDLTMPAGYRKVESPIERAMKS